MTNFGVDMMPLFVMDGVLPFQKFLLPIFEPRYRLMDIYPPEWSREREQTKLLLGTFGEDLYL
ncbi:unnamed protein product [Prunus armeniaca]